MRTVPNSAHCYPPAPQVSLLHAVAAYQAPQPESCALLAPLPIRPSFPCTPHCPRDLVNRLCLQRPEDGPRLARRRGEARQRRDSARNAAPRAADVWFTGGSVIFTINVRLRPAPTHAPPRPPPLARPAPQDLHKQATPIWHFCGQGAVIEHSWPLAPTSMPPPLHPSSFSLSALSPPPSLPPLPPLLPHSPLFLALPRSLRYSLLSLTCYRQSLPSCHSLPSLMRSP